jgi:hypothetical protein
MHAISFPWDFTFVPKGEVFLVSSNIGEIINAHTNQVFMKHNGIINAHTYHDKCYIPHFLFNHTDVAKCISI